MKFKDIDISRYETILLDRDGVINRLRVNDYVKCWAEFEFLPDVLKTISCWTKQVRYIFVVTNQRGVGKGIMTEQALADVHGKMCAEIANNGGRIDKVYYCTALTCDDIRRKPGRGMFDEIQKDYPEVKNGKILMIGDSQSDKEFAKNCGIDFVKV